MKILAILLSTALLLGGCTSNAPRSNQALKNPTSILEKSAALLKRQRWGEAQKLLEEGAKRYPEDQAIRQKMIHVRAEWKRNKRRLEDWILVYETEGMLLKRPLLVSMSQSDPSDFLLKSRLLFLDSSLNLKRKQLVACTQHQFDLELKLAKRCIESAKNIHLSIQVQGLLKKIKSEQKGVKERKQIRAQKKRALSRAESRNNILAQARSHLQQRFYYEAVKILEPLLVRKSRDQELNVLMEEAKTGRDLQVLQLISHGDRLYREEQIQNAVAIWEQAAIINPNHAGIAGRIDRAKKVLKKLQEIRAINPVRKAN